MSRLTAWIASRRQARRTGRAPQEGGARASAARPLRFERYEERIALTTNAALDVPPIEPYVFYVDHVDVYEGGFINFSGVAGDFNFLIDMRSSMAMKAASDTSYYRSFTGSNIEAYRVLTGSNLEASASLSSIWAEPAFEGFDYAFADSRGFGDGDSPELLATDSHVVPIPPPISNPIGNEGGQIAMTPFMGPATLGLPTASRSLYASDNRPALHAEIINTSAETPTATPAETLRGRAVVYEVAHAAGEFDSDRTRLGNSESALAKLDLNGVWNVADNLNAASHEEHAAISARRMAVSFNNANGNEDAGALTLASTNDLAERQLTEAMVQDREDAGDEAGNEAATQDPAANDAAFEQWQDELAPAFDAPEVGVATADSQQRRVLGAAMAILGAIPVTKAMRRRGRHESLAHLPRERRALPPATIE